MSTRRWLLAVVAGLALLLVVGRLVAGGYAEWTWYAAMGALPLYQSILLHETLLRGGALLAGFGLAFANLHTVRRSIVSLVLPRRLANIDFGEEVPGRRLGGLVLVLSVVIALLLAIPQDEWVTLALARYGIPFGERDPYQDRDFGFYLYNLPLEQSLFRWTVLALLVVGAVVVFLYAITPSLRWQRGRLHVSTYVRRHFAVLTALMLLVAGWNYRLDGLSLLTNGSGPNGAFTAFDDKVFGPLLTGLSIAAFACAFAVLWAVWHGLRDIALAIIVLVLLAGPGARLVLPMLDRTSASEGERLTRERPYQSTRTQYTRRAFGVDEVVDADSAGVPAMTRGDAARGVSNWDHAAVVRTAELAHRGLATIASSWEPTAAGLAAVVVQRPAPGGFPGEATITRLDASAADELGRAFPHITDPAESDAGTPAVLVEPGAPPYAVLADSGVDLAAPSFTTWWERLAHAWHLQNPRLLAMEPSDASARIVFHRDVRDRVAAIAPFFTIGPTLQSAVVRDSLYWFAELFVTSGLYPLARPLPFASESRQYVRHAATAVVQAHTGRVYLVADRKPDAVARTWMRLFPALFVLRSQLPNGLAQVWPPPVDRAAVQGDAIALAGFPGDTTELKRVAVGRESLFDVRDSAPRPYAQHGDAGPLTASIAVLESRERVVGVLLARGGASPGAEWHRIAGREPWRGVLDALWSGAKRAGFAGTGRGTERKGQVQMLPLRDGMAFVQSFYTWPPDAPPALRGVVLLEGGATHTGATLSEALGVSRAASAEVSVAFRARVAVLYEEMSAAMRRSDWKGFGEAYLALGRLLRGGGQ